MAGGGGCAGGAAPAAPHRTLSLFLRWLACRYCSGVTLPGLACHPGLTRMLHLHRQQFWWPSMTRDTRAFVAACPVCARGNSSHRPPVGLLQPMPIPRRPWFHIALDCITSPSGWLTSCPSQAPLGGEDGGPPGRARGPPPQDPQGHCLGWESIIHVLGMEGLLLGPTVSLSFGYQRSDGEDEPVSPASLIVEHLPAVGGVFIEFPGLSGLSRALGSSPPFLSTSSGKQWSRQSGCTSAVARGSGVRHLSALPSRCSGE